MRHWQFENSWHQELPGSYHAQQPDPILNPVLVAYSANTASLLDITQQPSDTELCCYFSGAKQIPGSQPLAQVYAGHQFGQYVSQLGDGRGLLLGEVTNRAGQKWDLHLKGAGLTPFSRQGDGRAVLRSSIREFLGSEAMRGLGIPTSHALCVIGSDTPAVREELESAATLLRVAKSHLRFGHFEYLYFNNQHEQLRALADYAVRHHFPECELEKNPYQAMLAEVVESTAGLIAQWLAVGFTHGVMNTDNMSLLGLTFDYGPYAFMDVYQEQHIPNHSDYSGRYAFIQQPGIGLWNLQCLARALSPLVSIDEAREALKPYQTILLSRYSQLMAARFGLEKPTQEDSDLLNTFMAMLASGKQDLTKTFRALCWQDPNDERCELENQFIDLTGFRDWWACYRTRRLEQGDIQYWQQQMLAANPKYILRTHLAHSAIEKAKGGDYSEVKVLQQLLASPYDELPELNSYADLPPEWSHELELSCSS